MNDVFDDIEDKDFTEADSIFSEEFSKEEREANKLLCKFKVKDEVRLTIDGGLTKQLLKVKDLHINKLGRIIQIVDQDTVLVDFWDTTPTKVQLNVSTLTLQTPAEEIAKLSAYYVAPDKVEPPKVTSCLMADGGEVILDSVSKPVSLPNTAVKHDSGKERVDLINPNFILEMGRVLGYGANKYPSSDYNYLEGQGLDYSRVYSSLQRHILKWYSGEQIDPESGIPHLIHAAANLQFLFNYDTMSKGKDDRRFK